MKCIPPMICAAAWKQGLDERGDAFITLPGGFGTFEEVLEVIALKQLGFHSKPIVLVNTNGYFDGLLQQFERGFAEALINEKFRRLYTGCLHSSASPCTY